LTGQDSTGSLSLRVAGDASQITTARSFAGSVGRVLDMNDGQRHDLRLAVSEIATAAIRAGLMELRFVVEFDSGAPVMRLEIEGDPPSFPSETSQLLGALFDKSEWSEAQPWLIRLVVDDDE
jgi:hypothetical protein